MSQILIVLELHLIALSTRIYPDWKVDSKFITEHLNDALRLDAKLSSHPIEVECPDANKIDQIFDALSYSKAASGVLFFVEVIVPC